MTLGDRLGFGIQGIVFAARKQAEDGQIALKIHDREEAYVRERDTYFRLQSLGITEVRGCQIPELIAHDNQAWIIAMTIVDRPFVLDFGSARLDRPAGFSEEVMADWQAAKLEQFGAHWYEVQAILREFESYGIFLEDVKPDNISVPDM